jgi:hypothetical protein
MRIMKSRPIYLLPPDLLPLGFRYPESYQTFVTSALDSRGFYDKR